MERIYEELYTADEFKGADKMIRDRILTHAEEAKEEMIREMKKENFADEIIAKIAKLPLEKIRSIQV